MAKNIYSEYDEFSFDGIRIGHEVPDMEIEAFHENKIKKIRLSDYRGKKGKWVILFFYPADFTFVCPTELEEMADHYNEFKKAGAEVLSVSTDTVFVHKAWHNDSKAIKKIKFPMLADPTGNLSRMMNVYIDEEGVAFRGSFIIDPEGVLQAIEVNSNDIGRNAKELLRKLQAAKFVREHGGQVCPASWEPGGDTLKPGLDLVGKI
ncbi:MAG: peroxiredoxin [Candidatus Lloydbacteria bacterium CG22_combo_CG10-13_8_21_14_all_47_15]|uniref:Peroxiredoxin n=1 Tax=Candidatus Lloydbacteria bacterium CG22_combo_CG10-13_8_21_14_all_47_15 TaxID=1974635 RepID=A0A2H0CVI5_9BACT|nr:MAG: peroxiredoxin [Candidatus Lloydbacteria bacterium CG22_combo_CG10-13_8_21_14_all_47_15]